MNALERLIVRKMLDVAPVHGWAIKGTDQPGGGAYERSASGYHAALEAANVDEIIFTFAGPDKKRGNVLCIFDNGNYGLDVISDYHTCLDPFMGEVDKFVAQLRAWFDPAQSYKEVVFKPLYDMDTALLPLLTSTFSSLSTD